jgi:hypothetical protein
MEPVKIKSGPTEVIASGTVIGFAGNPIEITFGPSDERLKLLFAFQDEEGEAEPRLETEVLDSTTLKLTMFNIKSPLGGGSIVPMPIGDMRGQRLYVHLRIAHLHGSDRMVHYSIYLSEEVAE